MKKGLRYIALVTVTLAMLQVATPSWARRVSRRAACNSQGQVAARTNDWTSINLIDAGRCSKQIIVEDAGSLTDPTWSRDGKAVAYGWTQWIGPVVESTEIRIRSVRDGALTTVLALPAIGSITEIDWSPDGRRFAFSLFTYNFPAAAATWSTLGSTQRIYVVNADGTGLRTISTVNASFDAEPRWAPDSRHLAFSSMVPLPRLVVVDADAPVPMPSPISPVDAMASGLRWSPTGNQIAFLVNTVPEHVLTPPELWVANADGRGARKIMSEVWTPAAWSPDEDHLVAVGSKAGDQGVWIIRPDGREARRLTFDYAGSAAWSPDGRLIAFTRSNNEDQDSSNDYSIWTIRPDGWAARRISEPLQWGYRTPVWRP
jgi:Tol biopolymer transport system component